MSTNTPSLNNNSPNHIEFIGGCKDHCAKGEEGKVCGRTDQMCNNIGKLNTQELSQYQVAFRQHQMNQQIAKIGEEIQEQEYQLEMVG